MLEVYQQMGIPARLSTTLQGQLVEMYSALKQGICALYLVSGAPKYPTKVEKKWWWWTSNTCGGVLHLEYNKAYGGNNKQDADWLNSQKLVVKSKFKTT